MCPNICFTTSSHVTQLTYVKVLIFFHTNASSEPKEGWGGGYGAKYWFKTFFVEDVASIPAKIFVSWGGGGIAPLSLTCSNDPVFVVWTKQITALQDQMNWQLC